MSRTPPKNPIESVDPELLTEFREAGNRVNAAADAHDIAIANYNKARAVFDYVGSKIQEKHSMGPRDKIRPNGTIARSRKKAQ